MSRLGISQPQMNRLRAERDPVVAIQNDLPRSRITLTYKTTVNGTVQKVNLPLRLMVLGDFSAGQHQDSEKDLDARPLHAITGNNLSTVMNELNFSLTLNDVPNRVDDSGSLQVNLPMTSMQSFSPDEIVKNVPKLRALLLMRQLIQELQGQIDNQSTLKKEIQQLFADKDALASLRKELEQFATLKLPASAAKSLTPGS